MCTYLKRVGDGVPMPSTGTVWGISSPKDNGGQLSWEPLVLFYTQTLRKVLMEEGRWVFEWNRHPRRRMRWRGQWPLCDYFAIDKHSLCARANGRNGGFPGLWEKKYFRSVFFFYLSLTIPQAYIVLLHFTDTAFCTNWKLVAVLPWASPSAPFSNAMCSLCVSASHLGNLHKISNFCTIIMLGTVICDQ